MAQASQQVVVAGRSVKVTNLDKVMYPATGTTKGDVIGYYQAVAGWFVPHAAGRPCTRKRFVHGVGTPDAPQRPFFHKNLPDAGVPAWVERRTIEHRGESASYPLVDDAATLVWLAQLAALELHVPQWRFDGDGVPRNPDRLVLDLDPGPGTGLDECVELATMIREVLDGAGLVSVPVTSGSKGLHVYAGLDGDLTCEAASQLAHELARSLEALRPDLVVSDQKKELREGKILLDWSQNNGAKTTIAPYSLRGTPRPMVAAPRTWDEIRPGLAHLDFHEVLHRLEVLGDPLAVLLPEPDASADRPAAVPSQRSATRTPSPVRAPAQEAEPVQEVEPVQEAPPVPEAPRPALDAPPVLEPMLATAATASEVTGDGWTFEVKWDGYRAIAAVADGHATWRSRRGLGLHYPELAEIELLLAGREAVLDGEIVVLDDQGRSRFELLQNHGHGSGAAHYMAFDLLFLDGRSLVQQPYRERRAALRALLGAGGRFVHVPDDIGTDADAALEASREAALEGVVAKRDDSVYQPGRRARTWLKIKNVRTQSVIVVGWAPGQGGRARTIGGLLLAVNGPDGLAYVGRAGSGFSDRALREAREVLAAAERDTPPLAGVPRADARAVQWVEPFLVGEVTYAEWTSSGRLRAPVWRGWRPNADPDDVVREG